MQRLLGAAVPVVFGLWVLILWEIIVGALRSAVILLPAPSVIWAKLVGSLPILRADFYQTFKAVLFGYTVGCLSGFIVAILADRVPFLRRGLLPIGNLVSALPVIGIAPIMVMWFGFDWPSKAAVVDRHDLLPDAGEHHRRPRPRPGDGARPDAHLRRRILADAGQAAAAGRAAVHLQRIEDQLDSCFDRGHRGRFFGTPIVGMGFRISTEVGRMGIDMVWAEIAVAALAGSGFYGLVTLVERAVTFWHPSFRT